MQFLLTFQFDPADEDLPLGLVANGMAVRGGSGGAIGNSTNLPRWIRRNLAVPNDIEFYISLPNDGSQLWLDQLVIEYLYTRLGSPWEILRGWLYYEGLLNGLSSGTYFPGAYNSGTAAATAVYVGGTFYGADGYQETGKTGNTASVTFTYEGSEASGGAATGVRWNATAHQGIFACIDSSGPTVKIYEMSSGWVYVQEAQTGLTLTAGNSYTLTVSDNGTAATASITDDSGQKTAQISTMLNTANTQVMFGWLGLTASHAFSAVITNVAVSQSGTVVTPGLLLAAGTYQYTQSLALSTTTAGAAIYYTTNGSTPTTSSTIYTAPISVSASETVQAIAALAGWTNSAVSGALYAIATWTMGYGTIDGFTSGSLTLSGANTGKTSATAVFASTWHAAVAYQTLGTSNNTVSVTFTYKGVERWRRSSGRPALEPFITTRRLRIHQHQLVAPGN